MNRLGRRLMMRTVAGAERRRGTIARAGIQPRAHRLALVGIVVATLAAIPGTAEAGPSGGEIVFRDDCYGSNVSFATMFPDGSGRRQLPAASVPSGGGLALMDVSSDGGPVTALFRRVDRWGDPATLFAVPIVRDTNGNLLPDAGVSLLAPEAPQPSGAAAVFSPDGTHVAYVGGSSAAATLYEGDVVRDAAGRVASIVNVREIVDLTTLGGPSDSPTNAGPDGMDYAPDGSRLVATVRDDLWILRLGADRALVSAERLTSTTTFAELDPRWSPVGDLVAFWKTAIVPGTWSYGYSLNSNIVTVDVSTGLVRQLSYLKNKWAMAPTWASSGTAVVFSAYGGTSGRNTACGSVINRDLFRVPVEGATKPTLVTSTVGTSVEQTPIWGW